MPTLDSAAFIGQSRNLKNFSAVYLLLGDEETLMAQCLQNLRNSFLSLYGSDNSEFNIEILHAEKDNASAVLDACDTLPLLAQKKLVIVKQFEKFSESSQTAVAQYCQNPNPSTCLVLLWNARISAAILKKALPAQTVKIGTLVKCWKLYENRQPQWIQEQLAEQGKRITAEASQLLAQQGGESLRELKTEIEKLILFVGDKKEIGTEDVKQTLSFQPNRSVWDLTQNLEAGRFKKAGQVLVHCLAQGDEPIRILNLVAWLYRKQLRNTGSRNEKQARNDAALFDTFKYTDLQLKSGQGIESALMERLITICGDKTASGNGPGSNPGFARNAGND